PCRDLALGHRLAELRHQDIHDAASVGWAKSRAEGRHGGHGAPTILPTEQRSRQRAFAHPTFNIRAYQFSETYCVSRNSISPSCGPSRPRPLCFTPPNGAAGSDTSPRLSPTMPKSSFSDTRMPRPRSRV